MANKNIFNLGAITVPLAGTEVIPIWNGTTTTKVTVANLTAGRAVATSGITNTGNADFGAQADSVAANGYSSRVSGMSVTNGSGWFGSYGRLIWNANAAATGGARRFAFVNGIGYTGFGLIRSVDANTDPALGGAGGTVSSGTLDWSVDTSGNITQHTGNLIFGTAAKGINFTANTPAAGMTSQLLNWYEEGTWTPNQGAGLTVVGAFSSSGTYTRVGRQVTVRGQVVGATSVAVVAAGVVSSNLPFVASVSHAGSMFNSAVTTSGVVQITSSSVVAATTIAATPNITFTATYTV